jgi:hypothetical protein
MKTRFSLLAAGLVLAGALPATAQQRCVSTEYTEALIERHPEVAQRMADIEAYTRDFVANAAQERAAAVTYTIPVVFHVVYNGSSENVPDAVVLSQLDVLNEDFRKLNSDAGSVHPDFAGIAADTEIEFCLASVDPSGNPTSGITRTPTTRSSFSAFTDNVKSASSGGVDPWPTNQYLNIWICDISSGILGYAQFPGGPASTDGVVIDYQYTGRTAWASGPLAPYNRGRTATHEVGHWLNLRHIWGDGGCSVDDGVSDTPVSDGANYGCNVNHTSCGTRDNVQNYMDYTDDACMVMFSAGQSTRMRAILAPGGPRATVAAAAATKCSAGPATCDVPANPTTTIVAAPTSAQVSWDAVPGAVGYLLQGRQVGGSFRDVSITGTSRVFNIFKANRSYEWRVQADCGGAGLSGYTALQGFTMPASRQADALPMIVAPNPATDRAFVDLLFAEGEAHIEILDLAGRVLQARTFPAGTARAELDLSDLAPGTYVVSGQVDGQRQVSRLVVTR